MTAKKYLIVTEDEYYHIIPEHELQAWVKDGSIREGAKVFELGTEHKVVIDRNVLIPTLNIKEEYQYR